jgi:hypothetical protein
MHICRSIYIYISLCVCVYVYVYVYTTNIYIYIYRYVCVYIDLCFVFDVIIQYINLVMMALVCVLAVIHEWLYYLTSDGFTANTVYRSLVCCTIFIASTWSIVCTNVTYTGVYHPVVRLQIAYLTVDLAYMMRSRSRRVSLYIHHFGGLCAFWCYPCIPKVHLILMTCECLTMFNWVKLVEHSQSTRLLATYRLCVILFYRAPLFLYVAYQFSLPSVYVLSLLDVLWMSQLRQKLLAENNSRQP